MEQDQDDLPLGRVADRSRVRKAERREAREADRYLEAVREVIKTPAGRLVFGELRLGILATAGVYSSGFDADPCRHAFNAGRRDIGLRLMALLVEASPEDFQTMEREVRRLRRGDELAAEQEQHGGRT